MKVHWSINIKDEHKKYSQDQGESKLRGFEMIDGSETNTPEKLHQSPWNQRNRNAPEHERNYINITKVSFRKQKKTNVENDHSSTRSTICHQQRLYLFFSASMFSLAAMKLEKKNPLTRRPCRCRIMRGGRQCFSKTCLNVRSAFDLTSGEAAAQHVQTSATHDCRLRGCSHLNWSHYGHCTSAVWFPLCCVYMVAWLFLPWLELLWALTQV